MADNTTPPADDVRRCANPRCPLTFAHDGPCAPENWNPPADDVREALEQRLRAAVRMGHWPRGGHVDHWITSQAQTFLAEFEVCPGGTVTDAEVEAAYAAALRNGAGQLTRDDIRTALEAARNA